MIVLNVRNAQEALIVGIKKLAEVGIERGSRNGPVLQSPVPVATVYSDPYEHVLFWPQRDANPFLHLYEALWMLAGRNDVAPLKRYAKQYEKYTDDGAVLHGAYGHRWRYHFERPVVRHRGAYVYDVMTPFDQLAIIANELQKNPESRRCVLGMWDPSTDLGRDGKDLPCNDTATFQIDPYGRLNLVVFCRSNDIVWGAYGANVVHFSILLEYMANWIGVPVGTYTQISVNWHGYIETLKNVWPLKDFNLDSKHYDQSKSYFHYPIQGSIYLVDEHINLLLEQVEHGFTKSSAEYSLAWAKVAHRVLLSHKIWKESGKDKAIQSLIHSDSDWEAAAIQWFARRKA